MRGSTGILLLWGAGLAALGVAVAQSALAAPERRLAPSLRLVRGLGLTDLCLTTEARYTRHLALADRHAAFQDHPAAREHFPSGALLAPPRTASHVHPAR